MSHTNPPVKRDKLRAKIRLRTALTGDDNRRIVDVLTQHRLRTVV